MKNPVVHGFQGSHWALFQHFFRDPQLRLNSTSTLARDANLPRHWDTDDMELQHETLAARKHAAKRDAAFALMPQLGPHCIIIIIISMMIIIIIIIIIMIIIIMIMMMIIMIMMMIIIIMIISIIIIIIIILLIIIMIMMMIIIIMIIITIIIISIIIITTTIIIYYLLCIYVSSYLFIYLFICYHFWRQHIHHKQHTYQLCRAVRRRNPEPATSAKR